MGLWVPFINLRGDTKAELKWVFKAKHYTFPKIEFTIDRLDLIVRFYPTRAIKELKKKKLRIRNFRDRMACEVLQKYPNLGRHFEEGIKTVYHDLGLPLCNKPALKDLGRHNGD